MANNKDPDPDTTEWQTVEIQIQTYWKANSRDLDPDCTEWKTVEIQIQTVLNGKQ